MGKIEGVRYSIMDTNFRQHFQGERLLISITNSRVDANSNVNAYQILNSIHWSDRQSFIFLALSLQTRYKLSYTHSNQVLRKFHSTGSCLSYLHEKITKGFDSGLLTGMVLIDLQKAFDTIDRNILIKKKNLF